MKRIPTILAALGAGTLAFAADGFSSWDTNRDEQLDQCEIRAGLHRFGTFADLDHPLSEAELTRSLGSTGYFGMYDADSSGLLHKDELDRFGGNFDAWDTDDDDLLSQDELYAGLYTLWGGRDGGLTSEELSEGFYETWDVDEDDVVTEQEFGAAWRALSRGAPAPVSRS